MSIAASLLGTALYLLPVAALLLAKWARDRPLDQIAVLIPSAVAADLLGILLLARLFQLDVAVVISRALWALGSVWLVVQRLRARTALGRPRWMELAVLGGAGCVALVLSVWLSRRYIIWDRYWHIPLVTSLRGQRIPFVNVFQPQIELGYHLTGDVLAATLQTLSGGRMHSSAALALAHDLLFVFTGIGISSLLLRFGRGRAWAAFAAVAPLFVFFSGPPNVDPNGIGYALFNFYQMSFRPHVVLAGLLIVGITAVVLRWLYAPPEDEAKLELLPALVMLAVLAATDEPSAVMIVPAIALVLLIARARLPGRWHWLLLPAAMTAVVLLAWLVLPSTVRGSARLPARIVAPQIPSFYLPVLPLGSLAGIKALLVDLGPMLVLCAALGWVARRGRGAYAALGAYGAIVLVLGTALLTCIVVAGRPGESHRFMTLPEVVLPLLVLCCLPRLPWAGRAAAGLGLALPVAFTANWVEIMGPELRRNYLDQDYSPGILSMDCRLETDARLFEAARPTYASQREWYAWSGCRPVLAPGKQLGRGSKVDVYGPIHGKRALDALGRNFLSDAGELRVACPSHGKDPICRQATRSSECERAGSWHLCTLAADRLAALLGRR